MKKRIDLVISRISIRSQIRNTFLSLDQEFQSHLEESVDDLIERGFNPREAHAEAMRRFGDLSAMRASAASEHVVKPLRKLGYMLVGLAFGVAFALILSIYNMSNSLAGQYELHRVNGEIVDLRARISTSGDRITIPMAQDIRFVTVDGAVRNPRVWAFGRRDDVTLGDLLHRSGWLSDDATGRVVAVRVVNGEPERTINIDTSNGTLPPELDTIVDASYLIYAEPTTLASRKADSQSSAKLVSLE